MITKLLNDDITYDGTQLSSGFVSNAVGGDDDAAIAFFGPVDVPTENLVDVEDRDAGAVIKSRRMVNFIIRLKQRDLELAVFCQRLMVAGIYEMLCYESPGDWLRQGDDIYMNNASGKFKLTVSIATTTVTGDVLIHIGINIFADGAPVPAIGLHDLGLDEKAFAADVLSKIKGEFRGIAHAVSKVRPVE